MASYDVHFSFSFVLEVHLLVARLDHRHCHFLIVSTGWSPGAAEPNALCSTVAVVMNH